MGGNERAHTQDTKARGERAGSTRTHGTTGGDDADAICSALEISSGETTAGYDPLVNFTSITPAPAFPHVPVILQL